MKTMLDPTRRSGLGAVEPKLSSSLEQQYGKKKAAADVQVTNYSTKRKHSLLHEPLNAGLK